MFETYKNHVIVSTGSRDQSTILFVPWASIKWTEKDGKEGMFLLNQFTERFLSADDAEHFAHAAAKIWINERLTKRDT
jgi:hypothetical protein